MRKTILTTAAAATFVLAPAGAALADTTPAPAPSTTVTTTTTKTESDKTGLWGLLGLAGLAGLLGRNKKKVEHVEARPVHTGQTRTEHVATSHDTNVVRGNVDAKDDLARGQHTQTSSLREDIKDGDIDGRNDRR